MKKRVRSALVAMQFAFLAACVQREGARADAPLATVEVAPAEAAPSNMDISGLPDFEWRRALNCNLDKSRPDLEQCGWPSVATAQDARYTVSALAAYRVEPSSASPFLPWPPPKPAHFVPLSGKVPLGGRFGDVSRRITDRLSARNYDRFLFYIVPGGFAVATELERFDGQGRASGGVGRFQRGKLGGWYGFSDFFHKLIHGEDGQFRVFVFVVTSKSFLPQNYPANEVDVDRWRSTGAPILPSELAVQRVPKGTTLTLMVYEFTQGKGRDPSLRADPRWTPITAHLRWLGLDP